MNVTEFIQERESALATFTSLLFSKSNPSLHTQNGKRKQHTSNNLLPRYRRPASANIPLSELNSERKRLQLRQRSQVEHLQESSSYLYDDNKNNSIINNIDDDNKNDTNTNKKICEKTKRKNEVLRYTRDEALRIRKRKHRLLMRRRGVAQRRHVRREQEMLCGRMQTLCHCVNQSLPVKKRKQVICEEKTECKITSTITVIGAEKSINKNNTQSKAHEESREFERREKLSHNECNEETHEKHVVKLNDEKSVFVQIEPLEIEESVNVESCVNAHEEKDCSLPCTSEFLESERSLQQGEHEEMVEESLQSKQYWEAAPATLWLPSHQHLCSRFHMTPYELSMPPSSVHMREIDSMITHECSNTELSCNQSDKLHTISQNSNARKHSEWCDAAHTTVTKKHNLHNTCYEEHICKVQMMVAECSKRKMHRCVERWASLLIPQEALPHSRSRYYRSRFRRVNESGPSAAQSLRRPPASLLADLSHHCIYYVRCSSQLIREHTHLCVKDILETLKIHVECCESSAQSVLEGTFGVAHFTLNVRNTEKKNIELEEKQEYPLLVFHGHMNVAGEPISCKGSEIINSDNIRTSSTSKCGLSKNKSSKFERQFANNVTVRVTPITLLLFPLHKEDSQLKPNESEENDKTSIAQDIGTCVCAHSFLLISPLPIQITHPMSSHFTFTIISLWTPCSISRCVATLYEWWCAYLAKNDCYYKNTNTKREKKINTNIVVQSRQDEVEVALCKNVASKVLHICSRAMSRVHSQFKIHENNNESSSSSNDNKSVCNAGKERTSKTGKRKWKAKLNVAETPMAWMVFPSFAQHLHHHNLHNYLHNENNSFCKGNIIENNNHCDHTDILPRCVWQMLWISGDALLELMHDFHIIKKDEVCSNSKEQQQQQQQQQEEQLQKFERQVLHSNWNNRKLKQFHFRTARVLFAELVRPHYTAQLVNVVYITHTKLQLLMSEEEEEQEKLEEDKQMEEKVQGTHKKHNLRKHQLDSVINLRFRCGVRTIGVIERNDLLHQLGKPAFPLDYGGVDELRARFTLEQNSKEHNMQLAQVATPHIIDNAHNKVHLSLFLRTLQCYGTVANAARRVVIRAARSRFTFPYISSKERNNKTSTNHKSNQINSFTNDNTNDSITGNYFHNDHHKSRSLHASLNYSQVQRGALLLAVKCQEVISNPNKTSQSNKQHQTLSTSQSLEPEYHVEIMEVCRVGVLTSEPFFMRKVGSEVGLVWCCFADPLEHMNRYSSSTWEEYMEKEEKSEQFINSKSTTWCLCSPSRALKLEHLSRTYSRSVSTWHQSENINAAILELQPAKRAKTDGNCVINNNPIVSNTYDNNNNCTNSDISVDMSEVMRSQELLCSLLCNDKYCNIVEIVPIFVELTTANG